MARRSAHGTGGVYPPPSISIRGSGGPYVVVVGNVAKGTTTEDIQLTFSPFGPVESVRERPPPSLNYPSLSFEVVYTRRDDAAAACASLNGCLADGRVLSVVLRSASDALPPAASHFGEQASIAARERLNDQGVLDPGPASVPRSAPEPRAERKSGKGRAGFQAAPQASRNAGPKASATGTDAGKASATPSAASSKGQQPGSGHSAEAAAAAPPPPPSLQKRMGMGLSPTEKKARALAKAAKAAKAGNLSTTPSLKSRITIPLAERITTPGASYVALSLAILPVFFS